MGLHLTPNEGSHYEPEDDNTEGLCEAGWWPSEKAEDVTQAIKNLMAETVYEDGKVAQGISVAFVMRLTLLKHAAEMDVSDELVREAQDYFAAKEGGSK